MTTSRPLIVALDFATADEALALAAQLSPQQCRVKVGKELFTAAGQKVVRALQDMGHDIFLDLKFHDIPNTVAGAVRAAADLGVWMVNVHASGGRKMMNAAAEALATRQNPPLLIAVTVLTSSSAADLAEIGLAVSPAEQVARLTALAVDAGMNGVVCAAAEARAVKDRYGADFLTVTPGIRPACGIRPARATQDDQTRIMTPPTARANGSDYLVIGRPITRAENPAAALAEIVQELNDK